MTTANQRLSNKHEDEVAAEFGGQVTPMSGAGWVSKNDVTTDTELIECKATENLSYSVRYHLMEELRRNALLAGKRPVLSVKLAPGGMRAKRLVVLTEDDYLELSAKAGERGGVRGPIECTETQWCDPHQLFGVHAAGA